MFLAATCAPACATSPMPTPAHLDVLEQEVGVEADVAGGHVEAAMVGHLSLPGAREAAQQHVLLDELPKGPAVVAVLLAQLQQVMESGAWDILQSLVPSPHLPQNQDKPSTGPRSRRVSSRDDGAGAGAGVLLLRSGTPRLTEGDGGPCLPVATCSVSLQEDS